MEDPRPPTLAGLAGLADSRPERASTIMTVTGSRSSSAIQIHHYHHLHHRHHHHSGISGASRGVLHAPLGPSRGTPGKQQHEEDEDEDDEDEADPEESTWPRVEAATGFIGGEFRKARELRASRDASSSRNNSSSSSSGGACSGSGSNASASASASSSISETARELCRAVSVSLGLVSAECHELGDAGASRAHLQTLTLQPHIPLASATDYLFEAPSLAQSCCARDDGTGARSCDHHRHAPIDMFKVGEEDATEAHVRAESAVATATLSDATAAAAREQHLFSITSLETKGGAGGPAAPPPGAASSCQFEPQLQLEPLCHREDQFAGGEPYGTAPPYGVKVKCEALEPWGRNPYPQNYPSAIFPAYGPVPNQHAQYGGPAGPRVDPYEREPWYRAPYTSAVKNQVVLIHLDAAEVEGNPPDCSSHHAETVIECNEQSANPLPKEQKSELKACLSCYRELFVCTPAFECFGLEGPLAKMECLSSVFSLQTFWIQVKGEIALKRHTGKARTKQLLPNAVQPSRGLAKARERPLAAFLVDSVTAWQRRRRWNHCIYKRVPFIEHIGSEAGWDGRQVINNTTTLPDGMHQDCTAKEPRRLVQNSPSNTCIQPKANCRYC
ncbi:hypothetical protein NFI96_000070 [Prochilodus magdalenae]|nr:hypothetical protein NFI96_000070 [Prochilodus magdalenae]